MTGPVRTLYTPAMLAAAMALADFAWDETLPLRGEARSRRCGSTLAVALALDGEGRIARIGIRAHACAVGQAAAHVFASGAATRTRAEIADARAALAAWLAGDAAAPDWPGVLLVEPALAYPARHDAILLAWDAALQAMA